jgi:uncharacterized protein with PIN domain
MASGCIRIDADHTRPERATCLQADAHVEVSLPPRSMSLRWVEARPRMAMTAAPVRPSCTIRLHGRLMEFVPPARRATTVVQAFDGTPAVKDPIEAVGVPHTEIAGLRIDGIEAPLTRRVRGGECIDVEPVTVQHVDHASRFVLDVHLGRLAGYLRLVGFDTRYANDADDDALVEQSRREARTLLTRDTGLLKRANVIDAAFVHATDPRRQLREVLDRFALHGRMAPFTRCAHCNVAVGPVDAAIAAAHVPPRVLAANEHFSRCPDCGRFYWRGTHESRLRQGLAEVGVQL